MEEKLKKCPCCGSDVMIIIEDDIANFGTDKWYSCSNDKCIFHGINLFPEDWQSRPIEDSLQKKLDIAMKAFDDILEFKRTGYFGLNFDVWQIIKKAMVEIEEIK